MRNRIPVLFKSTLTASLFLFLFFPAPGQILSEWRGAGRTGIYPDTGLLRIWPAEGPKLLWTAKDLPKGHSSVAIREPFLYLTGLEDSMDVLYAMDMSGKKQWKTPYGRAWNGSYPESRSTPTIDGDRLYVTSGLGDLASLDAITGKLLWSVKSIEEYGGKTGRWGIAESPVVEGDLVYYTCGGDQTTVIGLNKYTGILRWKSNSLNENPSYCSPLMIEYQMKKQLICLTENYILGINPLDGSFLWKFDYGKFSSPEKRNNHTNTPLFYKDQIFVTSGYDHKSVMLQLNEEASGVNLLWTDSLLDSHLGGVVRIDSLIFGSNWTNNSNGNWACISWNTGKPGFEAKWFTKGSIISADGLLYCLEEKNGNLALVRPDSRNFEILSEFRIPFGTGPCWAHPVIHDKILYVRHGDVLMAYGLSREILQTAYSE